MKNCKKDVFYIDFLCTDYPIYELQQVSNSFLSKDLRKKHPSLQCRPFQLLKNLRPGSTMQYYVEQNLMILPHRLTLQLWSVYMCNLENEHIPQPRPQAPLPGRARCTLRYGIDNSGIVWRCGTVVIYPRVPCFPALPRQLKTDRRLGTRQHIPHKSATPSQLKTSACTLATYVLSFCCSSSVM